MLTDSDIETILRFTGGKLEISLNPAIRIIKFNQPGVRFELITSSENPILALFISTDGPLVHYEIPVDRLEETRKSDQPGGIQMLPNLSFFGGERGRRLLSLTKHSNRFTVDPIWDGEPAQKTNS
jgi:hypothetical protein